MTFAKDDLIAALRGRYDYYSAESMFGVARERATLADKPAYDAAEVRALRGVLAGINDRLGGVLAHLDAMLEGAGTTPAPAPATAPPAPAAPAAAAPEEAPRSGKKAKGGDHKADKADKADAKPAGAGDTTIMLTGIKLGEGEHVLVCGGLPALGDWDPAKAAPMVADGDHWRLAVAVPAGADVAYKFLRRGADGTVTWEAGENRPLVAAPRVDATWR